MRKGMRILITGSNGFVGKNLTENLLNIKMGKNVLRQNIHISEIYRFDVHNTEKELEEFCQKADFVFHLAGVNRPKKQEDFIYGNVDITSTLLSLLEKYNNKAPIMLSSSIQASLAGRYENSEYGKSKRMGEKLVFDYAKRTGVKVCVYRFPNIFGKWCRPNYNSAVATFCDAVANNLEYHVKDREIELELLYIDDLIGELLDILEGKEHYCDYNECDCAYNQNDRYCYVPVTYTKTLGEIIDFLLVFKKMTKTMEIIEMPQDSFVKKLYSTYLSYLNVENSAYLLNEKADKRGRFAEIIKTKSCGQVSVNIVHPKGRKGQHWHNSKWEIFVVVSGHGLIQERKIGIDENGKSYPIIEFEVTGKQMQAVQILPGYAHNIINLSEIEDLVMVIWSNEIFNPERPDTYREEV